MPLIVVANPKGGVGKSTVSTHVAAYLACQGKRVVLADADAQQSALGWLAIRPKAAAVIKGLRRRGVLTHDLVAVVAFEQNNVFKGSLNTVLCNPIHGPVPGLFE